MRLSANFKKVIIFCIISFISIGLVLVFTVTGETIEALMGLNFSFLFILVGLWATTLIIEAVSLICFVSGTGERIGLWLACRFIALKNFFNIITPLNIGGIPFLIFAMSKKGISPGKASSAVLIKVISNAVISFLSVVIVVLFFRNYITDMAHIENLLLYIGILFIFFLTLFVVAMINSRFLIIIITGVVNLLGRIKLIKRVQRLKKRVIHEAYYARKSFNQYFHSHLFYFIVGNVCSLIYYLFQIITLYVVLLGLGIHLPVLKGLALSALQQALVAFQPTPGGAGFGEGVFVLLFKGTVPVYLLGIAIVLWRIFTQYLTAILGASISGSYFHQNSLSKPEYSVLTQNQNTK